MKKKNKDLGEIAWWGAQSSPNLWFLWFLWFAPHRSPQLGGGHVCSPGQQQLGEGHTGAQADNEALCDGRWPPDPPACLIHVLSLSPDPGHAAHLPQAHHH